MHTFSDKSLSSYFLLDPSITFLNHGSFGATPSPVFEAYQDFQRKLENEPVDFLGRQAASLLANSRSILADYLCIHRDDLVYIPNTTHGINIIARSLDLKPGDEVLTTDHEYGAMDRTWQFLSEEKGFSYAPVQISLPLCDSETFVSDIFSKVTKNTRVIFLSHITSPTALIFPIKEICSRAREAGIFTVIDGAHAPGQIDLDLGSLDADFYTGNCHKWLCAGKGSAFIFVRPEIQQLIKPLIVSWGWHAEIPGSSQFVDYLEWTGTRDLAPYLSVPAAIHFQEQHDWPKVRRECHELAVWIHDEICHQFSLSPLSASPDWFEQMVSIPLPDTYPPFKVQQTLLDDYRIEVPVIHWKDKTLLRVSVQGYNSIHDLEKLLDALRAIYGH